MISLHLHFDVLNHQRIHAIGILARHVDRWMVYYQQQTLNTVEQLLCALEGGGGGRISCTLPENDPPGCRSIMFVSTLFSFDKHVIDVDPQDQECVFVTTNKNIIFDPPVKYYHYLGDDLTDVQLFTELSKIIGCEQKEDLYLTDITIDSQEEDTMMMN